MLTPVQRNALDFIRGYIEQHGGVSPSFGEIEHALGLHSRSSVHRIVSALEERGHIRRLHNRQRAIQLFDAQAALASAPAPPTISLLSAGQLVVWFQQYREWWKRTRAGRPV